MVYGRGRLGKIRKYTQPTIDHPYDLDQIRYIGVTISKGYIWKSESREKRKQLLEGEDELWASVKKQIKYSKVTPESIEHMNEWIGNHPQVAKSPIYNETLLVPDTERPGKKIRVYKLLLKISINEIHNYLIYEGSIYKLK